MDSSISHNTKNKSYYYSYLTFCNSAYILEKQTAIYRDTGYYLPPTNQSHNTTNMEDGLTNEQTEKVLQLQDLTGIEDMSVCRDVLIRHQWDLEVSS